ncbi:hypothetical protein FEK66_23050 [Escherichia sp. E1130]|uniref:hypothetical protein n=1 Tax=Escherichia sp. E1130 TaxID=2041645 RepID=UPI0010FEFDC7|nr:hypothetical protein [Escherichia sp. E1130]TLI63244.1 hypothetical protein FEK66_23050 [Escherichia sp. E1130]
MRENKAALSPENLFCPACGGTLSLDSSSSMQISILSCDDCPDFRMQRNCDEDTLLEKFIGKHPECVKGADDA